MEIALKYDEIKICTESGPFADMRLRVRFSLKGDILYCMESRILNIGDSFTIKNIEGKLPFTIDSCFEKGKNE